MLKYLIATGLGLLVLLAAAVPVLTRPGPIMCDGGQYPVWVLRLEGNDHGCVSQPPLWEYLRPEHWFAEERCINCLQPTR